MKLTIANQTETFDPILRKGGLSLLTPLQDHPDYSIRQDPDYFSSFLTAYHSPLHLSGMEAGVALLRLVIEDEGRIHIIGDRDVDGVSSTAIFYSFLKNDLSLDSTRLSVRLSDDGDDYGVSGNVLFEAQNMDVELIIFLDMGSAHGKEIDQIRSSGKRVIVIDHHVLQLPPTQHSDMILINPLQSTQWMEHEGRVPTVGLVLKFLLTVAISYTAEWKRVRLIESGGIYFAYRIGYHMGEYASIPEAVHAIKESFPDLEVVAQDTGITLTTEQLQSLEMDPIAAGRWIFAALVRERPRLRDFFLRNSDLVSLGMITDVMPLVGENRMVTRIGLAGCEVESRRGDDSRYRKGYAALIRQLKVPPDHLNSRELGWSVGPTLNAAGRMGNTRLALDLLLAQSDEEATDLAKRLIKLNTERKSRTGKNEEILDQMIANDSSLLEPSVLFLFHQDLLPGVSGILASRYAERYHKPVLYINPDGEALRGSVRAFQGENVLKLIDLVKECFVQYGGHAGAAGFSLERARIQELKSRIIEVTPGWMQEDSSSATGKHEDRVNGEIQYHMEILPSLLNDRLMSEVHSLEPFGPGNPEPVFKIKAVKIQSLKFLSQGKHAKFTIKGAGNVPCLYWRSASRLGEEGNEVAVMNVKWNIYGALERSYFAGRVETRFRVESMEPCGAG